MQKFLTKSLTNLALASAVALPLIASSAYGANKTKTCNYDANADMKASTYIKQCLVESAINDQLRSAIPNEDTRNYILKVKLSYDFIKYMLMYECTIQNDKHIWLFGFFTM